MHPPNGTLSTDTTQDGDRRRPHLLPDPLGAIFALIVPRAVDSIDLNDLLDHVDIDRLIARVDLERVLQRVDIADLLARAHVEAMISAQAATMTKRGLDLVRRQLVGLDIIVSRVVDRILRRASRVVGPDGTLTGALAGSASRLTAFLVDIFVVSALFTGLIALVLFLVSLFTGHHLQTADKGVWYLVAYGLFALLYQWIGLVVFGRTAGMGLCGLMVLAPDRRALGLTAATRRVLVYPFSFVLGLGLVGIVVGRRHRALHDVAAPSIVCWNWGDRPVEMPASITAFLSRGFSPDGTTAAPRLQPDTDTVQKLSTPPT